MLTTETIKSEFSYITAWTGSSESYHNTDKLLGHGELCDIYFNSKSGMLLQAQVDTYNDFKINYNKYSSEIEKYIIDNLNSNQHSQIEKIKDSLLLFEVISIPQENVKYDMVLVCSKSYKHLMFFTKNISVRVEFINRKIQSIKITNDTTVDNN